MTESADWFDAMAKAMRQREKCLNAIERWTLALHEAEAKVKELGAQAGADAPAPGAAPETATESGVDLDYANSAE